MAAPHPRATYRLQLTPAVDFDAAIELVTHLGRLHVSHLYLSPIAEAIPGSTHGYDVVDHTRVRRELGGEVGFERLLDALAESQMAAIVDHVPNHVSRARPELNAQWWGMLRDGRGSPDADWFDVDWDIGDGRVIVPVLGAPLDEVLAAGQIEVDAEADVLLVPGRRLPLAPGTAGLALPELLDRQHYRLVHWREPARNVRRFFTVDDLVAVRVELAAVAEVVDTLPARYAGHAGFGGVRVDHVDGLADPLGYLRGLRRRIGDDALLYVEKILAPDERLPADWPVDGTTGYEFARLADHLVLPAGAEAILDGVWRELAGDGRTFHEEERAARREVVAGALAPELGRLIRLADAAVGAGDDGGREAVADEVRRLTTELPRYRTYLPDDPDAERLITSISDGPVAAAIVSPATPAQERVRTLWQQTSGPVMAKGAEDRAFYRYLRLASLCEVGGDPASFAPDIDAFHAANAERQRTHPRALLAGSTHDTKRSEDVRARSAAFAWRLLEDAAAAGGGASSPGPGLADLRSRVGALAARTGVAETTAWFAVQTVVTTPGLDTQRLTAYLVKASREARTDTSWIDPDPGYESELAALAELARAEVDESELGSAAVAPGISLEVATLRLTSPGVPDIYQGAEAFTHRLVDPDNRVVPDWSALRQAAADERTVAELWAIDHPAVKTVLVRTLLDLRRRRAGSFGPAGGYVPLDAGPGAVAYRRGDDVVVVVRRGLADVDTELALPEGPWHDVLDPDAPLLRGAVATASIVGSGTDLTLPVAVFERDR